MVVSKKQLIVFGGFHDNGRDYKYFNDVYSFNMEDRSWKKIEPSGKFVVFYSFFFFLSSLTDIFISCCTQC